MPGRLNNNILKIIEINYKRLNKKLIQQEIYVNKTIKRKVKITNLKSNGKLHPKEFNPNMKYNISKLVAKR